MKSFFFLFVLLVTVFLLNNCADMKSGNSPEIIAYNPSNALIDYGEHIFKREGCDVCHTLQIDDPNSSLISLDGFGGRRHNAWVYDLLTRPKDLIRGAIMPSFSFLHYDQLNKTLLVKVIENKGFKPNSNAIDEAWLSLNKNSDSIIGTIKKLFPKKEINQSESLALISYLQQIPRTSRKREIDSTENAKLRIELEKWEKQWNDEKSILYSFENIEFNIQKGKTIFNNFCSICHNNGGNGNIGPNLTDNYWFHDSSKKGLAEVIMNGTPKGMPSHTYRITVEELGLLIVYLSSIKGTNVEGKSPEGDLKN